MHTRTTLATAAVFAAGVMLGWPVQPTAQAQPAKDAVTAAAVLAEGGRTEREVEGSVVATSEVTTQGNPTIKTKHMLPGLILVTALVAVAVAQAQPGPKSAAGSAVPVTVENFVCAETDMYFGVTVKRGGFGKFYHSRELTPIDKQDFIRGNRDTLYSAAVFDLDAGPVTITLPDAGHRFLSMQVIDENHYTPTVVYGAGKHTFTREQIGTRYVMAATRTL